MKMPLSWEGWIHSASQRSDAVLLSTERHANGNMVGYSATAVLLLSYGEWAKHWPMQDRLTLGVYLCRVRRGVFSRYPDRVEDTAFDDYICLAAMSPGAAWTILESLKRGWGFLDVEKLSGPSWNWKQFLARSPGFVAHVIYGACQRPNAFLRLAWAFSVWLCTRKPLLGETKDGGKVWKNQDPWMQTHLMVLTYQRSGHRTWLCDKAVRHWWQAKRASMRDIVASYVGTYNHPLPQLWEDYGREESQLA
jgi:hypothetical protein